MGRLSVEETPRSRRPLYLPLEDHPYTPEQKFAFLEAHTSASGDRPVDQYWPRVRTAALECESALLFRETRKPSRNAWWRINNAIRAGKVAELMETHPEDANALLYGAMRAGVVTPIPWTAGHEDELDQLCRLGADERKAALAAAKAEGGILWKKTGRPKGGPVEDFATFLGKLYVKTTSRPLSATKRSGEWRGPAVRFMRAGLAPFYRSPESEELSPSVLDSPGLRSFVMRVRLPGSEELFPLPPALESAGLRSLIRRVKARLESSEP